MDSVKQPEGTTLVTGVYIEPITKGWVVTVVYDEEKYGKFAFTDLDKMLDFVKDMTGTPIRVPDGVVMVRETK